MGRNQPQKCNPGLQPIEQKLIDACRRAVAEINRDADEMAQEMFGRALDQLTITEGVILSAAAYRQTEQYRRIEQQPKADGPHEVSCIGCQRSFTCHGDH